MSVRPTDTPDETTTQAAPPPRWSRLRASALTICLFLFVVGANWATFDRFGSDMPDWDQWDAEGLNLFAPWFEHDHFLAHLFEPHNEHRVVLTKLQNLAVCLVAGQWDARAECACNALLHGLIAAAFWVVGRRWIAPRWHAATFIAIAALYGLPLAWQNLLGGFHSQQYWLIGLSLGAMLLLPFARPWTGRWWLGTAAATLALGSMGSGFLAAAAIFGVVAVRWLRRELTAREAWPTLVAMALLIAIGDLTRVEVAYHQHLKAKTAHDFIFSILRSLEWPLRDQDWAGLLTWAPWTLLAMIVVPQIVRRGGAPLSRAAWTLFLLGGWVVIQLLATAYARGAGADYPASRYMDTLIFATAVNALTLGLLLSGGSGAGADRGVRMPRRVVYAIALAWVGAVSVGTYKLVRLNVDNELPSTKVYYQQTEAHLRGYLATNDPAELLDPIPYPSASALLERLAHPALRNFLPQSVRPGLPLSPAPGQESTFVTNWTTPRLIESAPRHGLAPDTPPLASLRTWGSFTAEGAANRGEWRSAPLAADRTGWLKFETAGQIGQTGATLELQDAATGRRIAVVTPSRTPGNTWRSAYISAPRAPFVVVAHDADPHRWLAFSAPVEMSRTSYLAWQGVKNGLLLAEFAAALACLVGAWSWVVHRRVASAS